MKRKRRRMLLTDKKRKSRGKIKKNEEDGEVGEYL